MRSIVIQTCTQLEAAAIEARLEAEGIPVAIFNKSASILTTVVGGSPTVEVCVRAEDQARALQVLGLTRSDAPARHSLPDKIVVDIW